MNNQINPERYVMNQQVEDSIQSQITSNHANKPEQVLLVLISFINRSPGWRVSTYKHNILSKVLFANKNLFFLVQPILYYNPHFHGNPFLTSLQSFKKFLSWISSTDEHQSSTQLSLAGREAVKVLDLSFIKFGFMDSLVQEDPGWLSRVLLGLPCLESLRFTEETINDFISVKAIKIFVETLNKTKEKKQFINIPSVTHLYLPGLGVPPHFIHNLLVQFKKLKVLKINDCRNINDTCLKSVLYSILDLDDLDLKGCSTLTSIGLDHLLTLQYHPFASDPPPFGAREWKQLILPDFYHYSSSVSVITASSSHQPPAYSEHFEAPSFDAKI